MQRECGLSRRFFFERERSRFSLERDWGETARITASSGLYLFANCRLLGWSVNLDYDELLPPTAAKISPVRVLPVHETKRRNPCVFPPRAETIAMAALSRRYMRSVGQLCLVVGSWTNHKSQAVFFFFSSLSFTPSQWPPEDWFTDPAWWPSGERSCVNVCVCVHVLGCEEERRQVRSPRASSACITATPVTVSLCVSCGLWARAQQSRLTVVPSGMTNYLSCLIHTHATAGCGLQL